MLRSLEVEHYKSISNCVVHFDQLTVFVGRNSVGKSNIIETILFVRDCLQRGLDYATSERHGIDSILQWSRYRPFNLDIKLNFQSEQFAGDFHLKLGSKKREPVVLLEEMDWKIKSTNEFVRFKSEGEKLEVSGLDDADDKDRLLSLIGRRGTDKLILPQIRYLPFHNYNIIFDAYNAINSVNSYSIFPNTIREPQKPSSDHVLSSNGDNITSILKELSSSSSSRNRTHYQEIISLMKRIIPSLERILVRNLSGLLWLNFEVSESDGKLHQLNVSQISDGALRVLGLLVALYQPRPPEIIAIEEPEQNLHPGALGVLADAFKDRAKHIQVILTTHSPHLIDHFDVENLRSVTLNDSSTIISRISQNQRNAIKSGLLSASEIMAAQGFLPDNT